MLVLPAADKLPGLVRCLMTALAQEERPLMEHVRGVEHVQGELGRQI